MNIKEAQEFLAQLADDLVELINKAEEDSYYEGRDEGYEEGFEAGYAEGCSNAEAR